MKNIAFIINPISGSKETQNAKRKLPRLIMQTLDNHQWLPNIMFTERPGHATELAYQFARMGFDAVVAVGIRKRNHKCLVCHIQSVADEVVHLRLI